MSIFTEVTDQLRARESCVYVALLNRAIVICQLARAFSSFFFFFSGGMIAANSCFFLLGMVGSACCSGFRARTKCRNTIRA